MSQISPFALPFPELPEIDGLRIFTGHSGLKYPNRDDILYIRFDTSCSVSGVYTLSSMPSAPVDYCRASHQKGAKAKALCVNAGNANAFTGKAGLEACNKVAMHLSKAEACDPSEIYMASTGVIGEILDGDTLGKKAIEAVMPASWEQAAAAIMTTDTFPKGTGGNIKLKDGNLVSFSGIAKGSGMIAPNMGTMLAFLFTDASIAQSDLQAITQRICDTSFNAITVDGDTSTSDTFQVFATGNGKPVTGRDLEIIEESLNKAAKDLALQIVKDGEGISKLIRITVKNAISDHSARNIALSIANSPLVKTACAGEDANWGRIIMAIGKSGEKADRDKTSISMGGVTIAQDGQAVDSYNEIPVTAHMKGNEINIEASVGVGIGQSTVYTTDLTHRYIEINADYRS